MHTELKSALVAALPRLRAFAISLCGDADKADDLLQEAIVRAWTHIDKFEEGTNLRAWLLTILRNTYYSQLRKRRREVEDVDGIFAGRLAVLPPQLGALELDDVRRAMQQLPAEQREALLLVAVEELSYEQAAGVCGCAEGTVKSRVSRARTRLAQLLRLDGVDAAGVDALFCAIVTGSGQGVTARA